MGNRSRGTRDARAPGLRSYHITIRYQRAVEAQREAEFRLTHDQVRFPGVRFEERGRLPIRSPVLVLPHQVGYAAELQANESGYRQGHNS